MINSINCTVLKSLNFNIKSIPAMRPIDDLMMKNTFPIRIVVLIAETFSLLLWYCLKENRIILSYRLDWWNLSENMC